MKEKIFEELYKRKGEYISGEEISNKLGVSRTAVWKHINALKEEGYCIETVHRKGYRYMESHNRLLPEEIKKNLTVKEIGRNIIYFESIDSTNNYSKKIANEVKHGTLVLSEQQTGGRGRMGRCWISPKGQGIWMSLILKPDLSPVEGMKITQIAGASVCRAIRENTGLDALIKWPNDVVIKNKKVCGILTEIAGEMNQINFMVVGIGINVNNIKFPEDLEDVATSLAMEKGKSVDRKSVLLSILKYFEMYYTDYVNKGTFEGVLEICRNCSALLGKTVRIIQGGIIKNGVALEITNEGFLKVKEEDGTENVIMSGEVSIRGRQGYV